MSKRSTKKKELEVNFPGNFPGFKYKNKRNSEYLVVLIHGYGTFRPFGLDFFNCKKNLEQVREVIEDSFLEKSTTNTNNVDIYFPDLTKATSLFSTNTPEQISEKILEDINQIWETKKVKYKKIYFVGYSMGSLLARKVYVCACRETKTDNVPFEKEFKGFDFKLSNEWATEVDRIILLGGINRGWSINHHLSLSRFVLWKIGAGIGNMMMMTDAIVEKIMRLMKKIRLVKKETSINLKPLIFSIRKGASFITQLRVEWIYMRRRVSSPPTNLGNALVIQLLGSQDNLISPEDNVDSITGKDFIYLEVPFSNHGNVIEMKKPKGTKNHQKYEHCEAREEVLKKALTEKPDKLEEESLPLKASTEQLTLSHKYSTQNPQDVTDVIFVIHGIRDEGHWTNKIAQRVILENEKANEKRIKNIFETICTLHLKLCLHNLALPFIGLLYLYNLNNQRHFEIETSRYGYFPMLLFALPWTRRAKVAWFMDQYVENLALYPNAEFSFVGHSNGTYLLAQALENYQFCKFKRVVFAGSVVPKEYDWSKYTDERNKRVEKVLNYVATFDWVVAIFPNFLNSFQVDLGSAGHDGFKIGLDLFLNRKTANKTHNISSKNDSVLNIKYISGDHGAALNEHNWNPIAKFIVDDSPTFPKVKDLKPPRIAQGKRLNILSIIGKFPLITGMILIGILVGMGVLFWLLASHLGERLQIPIVMFYLWLIWKVLTII